MIKSDLGVQLGMPLKSLEQLHASLFKDQKECFEDKEYLMDGSEDALMREVEEELKSGVL